MTNTIDWNAPLEAYNGHNQIALVTGVKIDDDGDILITAPDIGLGEWNFGKNGKSCYYGWQIRNRPEKPAPQYPPELVERMVAHLRKAAAEKVSRPNDLHRELMGLVADLPQPVDPDRQEADRLADEYGIIGCEKQLADEIHAAIKRVRAEKG